MLASTHGNEVHVWYPRSTDTISLVGHDAPVLGVAFSPDGKELISSSNDGKIILWDYQNSKEKGRVKIALPAHGSLSFHPLGSYLAVPVSTSIYLYDSRLANPPLELKGHPNWVRSVAWLSGGDYLASGSIDGSMRIWNAETGEMQIQLENGRNPALFVTVNHSEDILASCGTDSSIRIWSRFH